MDALSKLYETHYAIMRYYAGKFVGYDASEDICQNVFLHFATKNLSYEAMANMVKVAIKNECLNYKKRLGFHDKYEKNHVPSEITTELQDIEQEVLNMIYDLIKGLATKRRRCFEMYVFENKDTEEIAKILKIPASTVRSHVSNARNQLKEKLKKIDW